MPLTRHSIYIRRETIEINTSPASISNIVLDNKICHALSLTDALVKKEQPSHIPQNEVSEQNHS